MAEILLYDAIYPEAVRLVMTELEAAKADTDNVLRICSPGGNVFLGWGIAAKISEMQNVDVQIDGIAASMAAVIAPFGRTIIALDIANIMLHRASTYVGSAQEQQLLEKINKDLRVKLAAKIDDAKLKEIKGVTLKDIFESPEVMDVWLTASEAKKIGLVDEVRKPTPKDINAIEQTWLKFAAHTTETKPVKFPNSNPTNMTIAELIAAHPELIKQIINNAITAERDRVGAWLAFANVDLEAVTKAIKAGDAMSQTAMAELMIKVNAKNTAAAVNTSAPGTVVSEEASNSAAPKGEKEKNVEAFSKLLENELGLKQAAK